MIVVEPYFQLANGIMLFAAALGSFLFAFSLQKFASSIPNSISKKIQLSFWLLAGFYISNFSFEALSWAFASISLANHFIYSINYMIVAACLFLFFYLQNSKKGFGLFMLVIYLFFLFLFFYDHSWHPNSRLTFHFVLSYYSLMGVVSALFLSLSLIQLKKQAKSANIRLGVLFFVYHFFALIISVFMIDIPAKKELNPYIYIINTSLSTLYYFSSAFLLFRMKKNNKVISISEKNYKSN